MKKKLFISSILSMTCFLGAAPGFNEFSFEKYPEHLVVNNRILLKINNKVITVLDVVRKMDLLFYRQYPELAASETARYQFYTSGWRSILGAVIDDSLIVADAEQREIKVNDGEVREELEKLFGPDVVINLDKVGMTLDEAFDLLKTELIVQRMTSIMVRSKAHAEIHPTIVKKRYEKVVAENPPLNYWVYKILSIRGPEHGRVAHEAHRLMAEQCIPFEELASNLEIEGIELAYSDELRQKESDLSLSYRAVLDTLSTGLASAPVSTEKVSRLFYLKEVEKVEAPPFKEMEDGLNRELMQEAIARYNVEYRKKLRKNYGLTEQYLTSIIPEGLQPFAMR